MFSQQFPERYKELTASQSVEERLAAQTAAFGLNQYQFAACLLQRWGLPNAVVEAVALGSTEPDEQTSGCDEQPIPVFAVREAYFSECPIPVL